nr:MAG TPA: hypothetical protein [Caudoviricetes sp.]
MSLYYRYGKELKENNLVKNIFYFWSNCKINCIKFFLIENEKL